MTLPPAASVDMLFLASLVVGLPVRTADGRLGVAVPGAGVQPVPGEALDRLEAGNLLDLRGDAPRVTRAGRELVAAWANRWHKPKRRKGRVV